MENNSDKERKDENSVTHTMNILKAASPYVGGKSRQSVDVLLKATELMDTFQSKGSGDLSACNLNNGNGDMEGMLNNIKNFCSTKERDLVDMMLNFMKAQKFYQTYRDISATGQTGGKGNSKNPYAAFLGLDENANMTDMLSSMLTPEQQSTFENLNMILSTMSTLS